jgi:hypothetical protein
MTAEAKGPAPSGRSNPVEELSEDLDVAIGEFLERHPRTSPRRIRQAIQLVERRADGGLVRRVAPGLALLAALVVGVVLGLILS